MDNHMEIKILAENIEKHVGVLLEEIEKQKKAILARAKQEALIELHNAKKLSKEIIDRTIRQTQKHLNAIKDKVIISHPAGTHPFTINRSMQNLEMYLKEINQISELQHIEKNEPELEFW